MTNQEILQKAIEKAIASGFYSFAGSAFGDAEFIVLPEDRFGHIKVHVKDWPNEYQSAEAIIFNKNFAKALWGEQEIPNGYEYPSTQIAFEYHLQQMVIADDPIKYLGDNI